MNIVWIYNFGFFFKILFSFYQLWGSRRTASGVKEKYVGVEEKCVRGQGEGLQLNTTHSAEELLLDPDALFVDP